MSNNKQSSIEWLISQLQKSKDFQRVLNEVSQMSSAKIDIILEAIEMHKDEMEAAIIKQCAEQSTSNASAYSDGYKEGLNQATKQ